MRLAEKRGLQPPTAAWQDAARRVAVAQIADPKGCKIGEVEGSREERSGSFVHTLRSNVYVDPLLRFAYGYTTSGNLRRSALSRLAKMEVRSAHVQAKLVKRSAGRNVIAAAAYRSGDCLHDRRASKIFDYSRRQQVLATRLIAPDTAPEWVSERNWLWNVVEETEQRKDAQLARELEVSIPAELDEATRDRLVWQFCEEQFVRHGMVADIAIHGPAENEGRNFHFHALLTMRELSEDGFGKKVREWNDNALLDEWKDAWVALCNDALKAQGVGVRLDRRSIEERRKANLEAAEAATDWIEERRHLIEAERLNYTPRPHLPRTPYKAMIAGEPVPDYKSKTNGISMPEKWRLDVAAWKAAVKSREEARKSADEMERQLEIEIAASVSDDMASDQTDDLDDQEIEEIHRLEVDTAANEVDTASSQHPQEEEDDMDYQQQAFEVIASMFDQQAHHLTARNNAATALLLHNPDWELEQSFQQAVPEVQNPSDVREVTTVLNADTRTARQLDDHWGKLADWEELFDVHDEVRQLGGTLADEAKQGRSWNGVQKNIFAWAIVGIAETIKRAVNALADLIRQEAFEAKNKPEPPPKNADSGSVKPKPGAAHQPQTALYPKP